MSSSISPRSLQQEIDAIDSALETCHRPADGGSDISPHGEISDRSVEGSITRTPRLERMNQRFILQKQNISYSNLGPPLPLMRFSADMTFKAHLAKTICSDTIKSIPNLIGPPKNVPPWPDRLHDPILSRKLSKWFMARAFKESSWRQGQLYGNNYAEDTMASLANETNAQQGNDAAVNSNGTSIKTDIFDIVAYEAYPFSETAAEQKKRESERQTDETVFKERWLKQQQLEKRKGRRKSTTPFDTSNKTTATVESEMVATGSSLNNELLYTPSLRFDADFESGNLEKATRVVGRDSLMTERTLEHLHNDGITPQHVDQEYDLILRNDINTNGNIQWYYFAATAIDQSLVINGTSAVTKFPLTVRFNIINMQKKDSLYNYGMKPALYSLNQLHEEDWQHGGFDICYYRNGLTHMRSGSKGSSRSSLAYRYSLSFSFTFHQPDTVYFAHTYPYTYSDLQSFLSALAKEKSIAEFYNRRLLCETLAGNRCDVLTITDRGSGVIENNYKPAIIMTARVHPGEANSSFMMHGFLEFITSDAPEAVKLRKSFVFTIIPMMNPDGVIHGNYRCSLAGTDLNRRYRDARSVLHPTVKAKKQLISSILENRRVLLYLDMHGHSRQKNTFCYGCDVTQLDSKMASNILPHLSPDEVARKRIFARVFPKVLCSLSNANAHGYFSFKDCTFHVQRNKFGTGRVLCWHEKSILGSYTVESSFCGNGDNGERKLLKKFDDSSDRFLGRNGRFGSFASPTASSKYRLNSASSSRRNSMKKRRGSLAKASASASFDLTDDERNSEQNPLIGNSIGNAVNGCGVAVTDLEDEAHAEILKKKRKQSKRDCSCPLLAAVASAATATGAADADALEALASRYENTAHYRKIDLIAMGRDIGLAIYHFANLSHSSLENELRIASALDAEERARSKRHSKAHPGHEVDMFSAASIAERAVKSADRRTSSLQKTSNSILSQHIGGTNADTSNMAASSGEINDGKETDALSDDSANDAAPKKMNSKTKDNVSNTINIQELMRDIERGNVEMVIDSMLTRSALKPMTFASSSIQKTLQAFPSDFITESSTTAVGMRMKCEYAIRRGLKLDSEIHYQPPFTTAETAAGIAGHGDLADIGMEVVDDDADNCSVSDSDSEPSVDNVPTMKMLKNIKKLKGDRKMMIATLRASSIKKRKQEIEQIKLREKKHAEAVSKQIEDARRLKEENEVALKKKKSDEAATEKDAPKRGYVPQYTRRKGSIFHSKPKHAPTNRSTQQEETITMPLQVKFVNFRQFDNTPAVGVPEPILSNPANIGSSSEGISSDAAVASSSPAFAFGPDSVGNSAARRNSSIVAPPRGSAMSNSFLSTSVHNDAAFRTLLNGGSMAAAAAAAAAAVEAAIAQQGAAGLNKNGTNKPSQRPSSAAPGGMASPHLKGSVSTPTIKRMSSKENATPQEANTEKEKKYSFLNFDDKIIPDAAKEHGVVNKSPLRDSFSNPNRSTLVKMGSGAFHLDRVSGDNPSSSPPPILTGSDNERPQQQSSWIAALGHSQTIGNSPRNGSKITPRSRSHSPVHRKQATDGESHSNHATPSSVAYKLPVAGNMTLEEYIEKRKAASNASPQRPMSAAPALMKNKHRTRDGLNTNEQHKNERPHGSHTHHRSTVHVAASVETKDNTHYAHEDYHNYRIQSKQKHLNGQQHHQYERKHGNHRPRAKTAHSADRSHTIHS